MIDALLILAAVATITVGGMTVFYAVVQEPQRYFRTERIVYSYPLGLAVLGMPMFVTSWMGLHLNALVVMALVLMMAVAVRCWRKITWHSFWLMPSTVGSNSKSLTEVELILVVIILGCLGARSVACLLTPLVDWDALCFWGLKSKICYFSTIKDAADYFTSPVYRFTNQTYPLLWPMMYAWVCTVLGRFDDLRMLAINPLNLIVFTCLFYFTMRHYVSRLVALAVATMVATLPSTMHYIECGQADIPLMLISGASLFALLDWFHNHRRDSIVLASILMGGALFVKHEGQILMLVDLTLIAASILFVVESAKRRRLWRHAALYVAIAMIMIAPWLWYRSKIPKEAWQIGGQGFSRVRWEELPTFLYTISQNALHWYNGVGLPKWNLLWPILIFFCFLSKAPRHYPWSLLMIAFALHAGAVVLIHLASQVPLTLQHEFALERYTIIMLPPLWIMLAVSLEEWWLVWRSSHGDVSPQ